MRRGNRWVLALAGVALSLAMGLSQPANAGSATDIDAGVSAALTTLYGNDPAAKELASKAKAILVFPKVVKGGLLIAGHYGEGALRVGDKSAGYYYTSAVSYGLQAGGQAYGYVMFFMNDEALDYLEDSGGFEIGVGPSVVVMDEGMAQSMTSTTATQNVYAIIFDQKGLMAGMGLQGSKITQFTPR